MMRQENRFPTTRWTLILSTGSESQRREAVTWLCERYWYPIYMFLRRYGKAPAVAQDLTQSFLMCFLERRSIERADPERGRFRTYLLGALKHFLADGYDFEQAKRRGGGIEFVPLSFATGEEKYLQCTDGLTPESLYERQWALSLIDRVLHLMRAEQAAAGKASVFDRLRTFLTGEDDYRQAAAALGMQESAVRVTVHRLRRRYRDLLTAEVAETVADPAEVQNEIRHLIAVLSD
ncbi:MAG: sigma factor [Bryobacteraceae bacterium]